jgi:membrane-associated protease RseP (regulator of RpoE activity)
MIKTLATTLLLAGLAMPAFSAGPDGQPEMQNKNVEVLLGAPAQGRSYLGVDIKDITSERVGPLKLKEERGVEVTMVDQDAPAGKAGLKEHDVILEFNGTRVESDEQLRRMIREVPPGRTVTLGISRDGNPMKISAQLADRSKLAAESHTRWPDVAVPRIPDFSNMPNRIEIPNVMVMRSYSLLGVQTEGLTRQLGDYFGVKGGEGLLVRSVDKGSAAEKAGIKAGDVLVKAENEKLTDRSDLARVLRSHRQGGKVSLGIVRDKKEQTVTVELPQRGAKDSSELFLDLHDLGSIDADQEMILDSLEESDEPVELPSMSLLQTAELARTLARIDAKQPEIQRAMRQAERKLHRVEKLMKNRSLIIPRDLDPLI